MIIKKCDICNKEIQRGGQEISVTLDWPTYSFCATCGEPIVKFLKKRGLLKEKSASPPSKLTP